MKTKKQLVGDWGERKAALFLLKRNYEIVCTNWQVRGGEIDIIAWHKKKFFGQTLCFVEVKTRSRDDGSAQRATSRKKITRMKKAATLFCLKRKIDMDLTPIEFEQISLFFDYGSKILRIRCYSLSID